MAIRRDDAAQEWVELHDRLHRLFDLARGVESGEGPLGSTTWMPPCDIVEDRESLRVLVEVPGIRPEEIDIRLDNNTITLRGRRQFEQEQRERNYHRVERSYGAFMRSFALPVNVDEERVNASYQDGVLEIRLPKRDQSKPRQIKISSSTSVDVAGPNADEDKS